MVSEDSDQFRSGLPPVHRLRDLSDLDESCRREMAPSLDELHTRRELLEVRLLRAPKRVLTEKRNDRFHQILAPANDELGHVLAMVVMASVDEDSPAPEEALELLKDANAACALRHRELRRDLVSDSVAFSPRAILLPHEADREASFSVYKADHPATKLDQPFLLIFRIARHIVTIAVRPDRTMSSAGFPGFPAFGQMRTTPLPMWGATKSAADFCTLSWALSRCKRTMSLAAHVTLGRL
jgi:hypothetical protein